MSAPSMEEKRIAADILIAAISGGERPIIFPNESAEQEAEYLADAYKVILKAVEDQE